tara:strand:- start:9 stop:839 length:831 start_codon:yes stop_codon:yes gene_type:complete
MSGAVDAVGDVVGSVLDTAGDVVSEAGDFVGDVVSEIDFEDALKTYIQTGSVEAAIWAATPGDEKIGYDYGVKGGSDNDSGGGVEPSYTFEEESDQPFQVSFMPGDQPDIGGPNIGSPFDPSLYDQFGQVATNVVNRLKDKNESPQIAQNVVNTMSGILSDVASGKFSKSPAAEYNTRSVLDAYYNGKDGSLGNDILNRYGEAKKKVAEYISTPSSAFGEVALQGNPFYNFMQQRDIGKRVQNVQNIFGGFLSNMPQSQQTQPNIFEPYLQEKGIV